MGIHEFRLAGHPATLNQLLRTVRRRISLKKRDRDWIYLAAHNSGIPRATGKRRVALTIILERGQRAADPDAYHKSVGDALKQAGLIVNDSYLWIEWAPTTYQRGDKAQTLIRLEDLNAEN